MNRLLTVNPRVLAHCRMCNEPLYCIYDQNLRDVCYECTLETKAAEAETFLLQSNT